jgi:hypothetical protein
MASNPKVWTLRAEDIDMYRITELGVFKSRNDAIDHLISMVNTALETDYADDYNEWLEDVVDGDEKSTDAFCKVRMEELKEKIREWLVAMDAPMPKDWKKADKLERKRSGVTWGIDHYVFSEVDSYL